MADILLIIIAVLVLLALAALIIVFFLLKKSSDPISFEKTSVGSSVVLTIKCNSDIKELRVSDLSANEKIEFLRKNLTAGEILTFSYPYSKGKSKLKIHVEDNSSSYDFTDNL